MEIMRSAAVTLGNATSSRCSECESRMTEITRLQNEVNNSKDEIRRLLDDIGDLAGRIDESEAIAEEKEETIKSLQLSLKMEQEARATLDTDFRTKADECLSLLNSLEMLSMSSKEKNEEHRLAMEKLRSELNENNDELKKSHETISQLTAARLAAEEISASLQETVSSLSDQLKQ
ncbi:hypothetical protein OSTOST_05893, partial [Ostertagia ostertagi]